MFESMSIWKTYNAQYSMHLGKHDLNKMPCVWWKVKTVNGKLRMVEEMLNCVACVRKHETWKWLMLNIKLHLCLENCLCIKIWLKL